jgi:hypothetical protein
VTATTRDRRHSDLDERTARAWAAYCESLRDLGGREYEDAETRSWKRLQHRLSELDGQRAELEANRRPRRGA